MCVYMCVCVAWDPCGICMGLACAETKPTEVLSIRANRSGWMDGYFLNMIGVGGGRGTTISIHLSVHWNWLLELTNQNPMNQTDNHKHSTELTWPIRRPLVWVALFHSWQANYMIAHSSGCDVMWCIIASPWLQSCFETWFSVPFATWCFYPQADVGVEGLGARNARGSVWEILKFPFYFLLMPSSEAHATGPGWYRVSSSSHTPTSFSSCSHPSSPLPPPLHLSSLLLSLTPSHPHVHHRSCMSQWQHLCTFTTHAHSL